MRRMPLAIAGLEDGGRRLPVNGTGGLYKLRTRNGDLESGSLKELNSSNNLNDKRLKVSPRAPRKECSSDDTDFSSVRLCLTSDL